MPVICQSPACRHGDYCRRGGGAIRGVISSRVYDVIILQHASTRQSETLLMERTRDF